MKTDAMRAWPQRLPWRFGIGLVEAGAALAVAGTLLGYLGRWHWFLDLFAHFRGQYFAALVATALFSGVARRPWSVAVFLAAAVANAVALSPLVLSPSGDGLKPAVPDAVPALRVATYNMLYLNRDSAPALKWLRSSPADVVFLCEVTPKWSAELHTLSTVYPHQHHCPQTDPFGCALLSKKPWAQLEEKSFGQFASPALAVRFVWNEREVLLVGMHPTPPNGGAGSAYRDTALAEAATFLAGHPVRTQVLVGDLNATPWCFPLRSLVEKTRLADTARGRGWQPTWNVGSLLFQIPIDHVLVSHDLRATERTIGPDLGSDHRAVIVELKLAP